MRLTALRQSPKDISGPKHPRQMQQNLIRNDSYSTLLSNCKPISSESGKCGRARPCAAPYGGAVREPRSTDQFNPLPELTTLDLGTCKDHLFPNPAPTKNSPHISPLTSTKHQAGTLCARGPVKGMRPRDGGDPNVGPHPQKDRRQTSPLLGIYLVGI